MPNPQGYKTIEEWLGVEVGKEVSDLLEPQVKTFVECLAGGGLQGFIDYVGKEKFVKEAGDPAKVTVRKLTRLRPVLRRVDELIEEHIEQMVKDHD